MNKVRFNIDRKKDGSALIMMLYRHPNGVLKYSTGEKIPIEFWNDKIQRAKVRQDFPEGKRINSSLYRLERTLHEIITDFNKKDIIPSNQEIKEKLDELFRGKIPVQDKIDSILEYAEIYVEESRSRVSENTIATYWTAINKLKLWLGKKKLTFTDLTNQDFKDFANFSWDMGFQDAYVAKLVKTFSAMVNAAILDERTTAITNPFNNKAIGIRKPDSDNIFLDEKDIEILIALDLSKNKRLENIRDNFVFCSYTGLRYIDLKQIGKDKIETLPNGSESIRLATIKTNKLVEIPIKPIVKQILEKYDYKLKIISNAKANVYLKELGELVGFIEDFVKREFRKGKPIEKRYKRWEVLMTHTARRSFITNALLAGIAPHQIMKMTGHSNMRTFESYIKFNEKYNAIQLSTDPFFSK